MGTNSPFFIGPSCPNSGLLKSETEAMSSYRRYSLLSYACSSQKSGLRVKAVKGRFGRGGRPQIDSLEALVGLYLAGPCMALRALGSSPPTPTSRDAESRPIKSRN